MAELENVALFPDPESQRTRYDFILAGCICLLAAGFWFWDNPPNPASQPASTPAPQVAAARSPGAGDGFNNAGLQLYQASDFTGAEAQFRQAISAEPAGATGYCNLGAALIAEHRYDEAIAALEKSLALDPALALARNNLNWALEEQKKHKN